MRRKSYQHKHKTKRGLTVPLFVIPSFILTLISKKCFYVYQGGPTVMGWIPRREFRPLTEVALQRKKAMVRMQLERDEKTRPLLSRPLDLPYHQIALEFESRKQAPYANAHLPAIQRLSRFRQYDPPSPKRINYDNVSVDWAYGSVEPSRREQRQAQSFEAFLTLFIPDHPDLYIAKRSDGRWQYRHQEAYMLDMFPAENNRQGTRFSSLADLIDYLVSEARLPSGQPAEPFWEVWKNENADLFIHDPSENGQLSLFA